MVIYYLAYAIKIDWFSHPYTLVINISINVLLLIYNLHNITTLPIYIYFKTEIRIQYLKNVTRLNLKMCEF
jgi:hypothetical protein